MELPKIKIKDSERVIFVGTTGFGKTVLAKHFLSGMNRVLVIDPKHEFRMDGYRFRKSLPPFNKEDFHIIYRPNEEDDWHLADLLGKLFSMKKVTIYCDELATLSEYFPVTTKRLADISRTGREKHVAVWAAVQRPRWTPRVFFTETEVFFQFHLNSAEDRFYMSDFTAPEAANEIDYFQFWYKHIGDKSVNLMKLDLTKNGIMLV